MKGGRGGAKGVSCERSLDGWEPSRHPFPSTPPIDDIRFLFHCISIAGGNALLGEDPLDGLVGFTKKLFNSLQ